MARFDACFEAEVPDIVEVETEKGKAKIRDKKLIVKYIDSADPFNQYGKPVYSVGMKMTASIRVYEQSEKEGKTILNVHEIPQLVGSYFYIDENAPMKEMQDVIKSCINECVEQIKTLFGQDT